MTDSENQAHRTRCPIAAAVEELGDRWSLVILRDMFLGKRRYNQFLASPEGITTNILAARLRRLEASGLIEKRAYQHRPLRFEYSMTGKGEALQPLLNEMCRWANDFLPGTRTPPAAFAAPGAAVVGPGLPGTRE